MRTDREIKLFTPFSIVLVLLIAVGLGVGVYRMSHSLGAVTNMNDGFPWGLWLAFDVLGGVAMAAGGFIIAAAVYLLNMKKYQPIVRPAILTAFLGYLLEVIAVFLDVGHPFRLWHPAVMWQVHSVMWVVAVLVMLYTATLVLELSPMLFERLGWSRAKAVAKWLIVPIVLCGGILSVLHQSSLGALFLIAPGKLSPLWYSSLLPYLFLVSALMMGLAMVSLECVVSARAFGHEPPEDILAGLAKALFFVLGVYLLMKLVELVRGPGLGAAFDGGFTGNSFLLEMVLGVLLPLALLVVPRIRKSFGGIVSVNGLVIGGVLLNRLNVCILGSYEADSAAGYRYFPSATEVLLSIGLVALGIFLFKMAAKYLNVFPKAQRSA